MQAYRHVLAWGALNWCTAMYSVKTKVPVSCYSYYYYCGGLARTSTSTSRIRRRDQIRVNQIYRRFTNSLKRVLSSSVSSWFDDSRKPRRDRARLLLFMHGGKPWRLRKIHTVCSTLLAIPLVLLHCVLLLPKEFLMSPTPETRWRAQTFVGEKPSEFRKKSPGMSL